MGPQIGSLFSGSGQLDEAVRAVLGGRTVWVSDVCKVDKDGTVGHHEPCRSPCSILAHRFPDAPNLGDISLIDWTTVEPVDVLTLGFPCQDLSAAGKQLGLRPGTRSGLWSHAAYAISQLKPRLVVIENVRGLLNASAHSNVEPCAWCVGDPVDQHALRALGAVLGDLADLGRDAEWVGLPASDVGAPHGRPREFVLSWFAADTGGEHGIERWIATAREAARGGPLSELAGRDRAPLTLLPTPDASAEKYRLAGDSQQSKSLAAMARRGDFLLPTPVTDPVSSNGHARDLGAETKMLPTPTRMDHASGGGGYTQRNRTLTDATVRQPLNWGKYADAITQWEQRTRPAPESTEPAPKGGRRLSRWFDEWMMGWPAGWVTDVPGITWNEVVKACGNGVVPQQAEAALRHLLPLVNAEAVA